MYFLLGLGVSFGSLFLTAVIGSFLHREGLVPRIITASVLTFFYALVLWWYYWGAQVGVYGPTPFIWSIIVGAIIGGLVASVSVDYGVEWKGTIPAAVVVVGYVFYLAFVGIGFQSDMFNSKEKARLIGQVETINNLSDLIEPADNTHICLVSEEVAKVNAQDALSQIKLKNGVIAGSRYVIGEPTKQFVDGSYWWIFPLEFNGWLKWKQDPQAPGYLRVSAENPVDKAQAVQTDKNGEEIHVKYLNSACFEYQAERYLRENGFLTAILRDWTYEVNDDWKPYYTITVVERTMGFAGEVVKGIILMDLQTGELKYYDKNNIPAWIDRVFPLEIIDYNAQKWGLYSTEDWLYKALHDDKSQKPTPGWFLTYGKDNKCQWFTGFTSTNDKDNALTGFMIVDANTGKTYFYQTTGVTESVAYDAALTMWNNFSGYKTTELVPYNIYGYLTYVIPMKCNKQFSGVSLVALNNINIKAKGDNLEQALQNYRTAIGNAAMTGAAPTAGLPKNLEVVGKVERIGLPMGSASSTLVSFKMVGIGKIFQATYSEINPEPIILNVGDTVKIRYSETTEIVVPVDTFDILNIILEKGSVNQAKAVEEQEVTGKEINRVSDQQDVQNLIESKDMKKVDPDELRKFINEQKENKQ